MEFKPLTAFATTIMTSILHFSATYRHMYICERIWLNLKAQSLDLKKKFFFFIFFLFLFIVFILILFLIHEFCAWNIWKPLVCIVSCCCYLKRVHWTSPLINCFGLKYLKYANQRCRITLILWIPKSIGIS